MGTASANRFQRNFMIYVNEDGGFEEGGKPNGHVRLEIRNGKGRLDTVIHNLRDGKGRFRYVLYLIRQSGGRTDYARIGEIRHTAGRAELKCELDPLSLDGSVRPADEYDIAAVVVEYEDRPVGHGDRPVGYGDGSANSIICPLAAYRRKPAEWRSGFRKALSAVTENAATEITPTEITASENTASDYTARQEQYDQPDGAIYTLSDQEPNIQPDRDLHIQPEQDLCNRPDRDLQTRPDHELRTKLEYEQHIRPDQEPHTQLEHEQYIGPEQEPEPLPPAGHKQEHVLYPSQADETPETQPTQADETPKAEETADDLNREKTDMADASRLEKINTGCVYLNGHLCDALVSNKSDPDPCGSCRINRSDAPAKVQLPGNLKRLERDLDNNFEVSDPFHSGRSDYKWWRVTNPVNLNNILYQNNIRSPLMFNPVVMLAHYKYKHLIIGIFHHKNGKKYVVCGVPGRHMTDTKPFGEMNKWVQTQGTRPRYGAFGYWLVYIDPDNGKILHPNRQ